MTTEDVNAVPAAGTDATLALSSIVLDGTATDKLSAITEAGNLLVATGNVAPAYVESMHERERSVSTDMGNRLAIPHGTNDAKEAVEKTGVVLQQYPDGVDFDGEKAYLVFGIAGKGEEHLEVLANICRILEDESVLEKMKTTDDVDWVVDVLSGRR